MKKNLILIFVSIPLLFGFIASTELVELPDLTRPSIFLVNQERAYILEEASVYIYSLKNTKLLKKFGKAGEGPQEFKYDASGGRPLSMSFFKNQLIVNSEMKMSFFDLDGNYIKENKVTVDRLLFPVDGKFLGIGPTADGNKKMFIGFTIYDKNFKSPNVIFLSDFEMSSQPKLILPATSFTYNPVYNKKIFANVNANEFRIDVFNIEGKKEYTIEKKYPKINIPASFREKALEFFKKSPRFKNAYEVVKKILRIREYYPPIRDLQIKDDLIYALTFKRKGDLWELIKLDLKGNEKGRTFIRLNEYEYFTWYPIFYSVYKDNVYTLVEDEDEEIWKVYVAKF